MTAFVDFLLRYHSQYNNTADFNATLTFEYLSLCMFTYVQDRRNNCDTKCSMCEISNASLGGRWMTAGKSRYSDTMVYNKFRRQTRCVRYLDAPTLCVMPGSILWPSRIPDTYQRNYEICKQTRCNDDMGATRRPGMFSSIHEFSHIGAGSFYGRNWSRARLDDESMSKILRN